MVLKRWPLWLKTGIILAGIYLITSIVAFGFLRGDFDGALAILQTIFSAPSLIGLIAARFILTKIGICYEISYAGDSIFVCSHPLLFVMMLIFSLITYFLFGALIGKIAGKLKKK